MLEKMIEELQKQVDFVKEVIEDFGVDSSTAKAEFNNLLAQRKFVENVTGKELRIQAWKVTIA